MPVEKRPGRRRLRTLSPACMPTVIHLCQLGVQRNKSKFTAILRDKQKLGGLLHPPAVTRIFFFTERGNRPI